MNRFYIKEKKVLHMRFSLLFLLMSVIFGVLIINLIDLQIVKGNENLFLSSTIKTNEEIIRATRGLIYDREGNLLVINKPSFKLLIEVDELPEDSENAVIIKLADILEVDRDEMWNDYKIKVYDDLGDRKNVSSIILLSNVERDKIISIHSNIDKLPGVYIEVGTRREYVNGEIYAHIVGYVREVTSEEISSGGYMVGDTIGAVGIEQFYDSDLRGVNGKRVVETDRDDTEIRELIPIESQSGKSVKLTIDSEMQEQMTRVLSEGIERNNADGGVAVIMDVTSGEILTLVSLPSYDPNAIVGGLSYSEYTELQNNEKLPLYNRAISMTQPPGSTFKTIVASVGLEEGSINTETIITSEGCMDLGEDYEFCEVGKASLGKLNIYKALARSSNIYFCETMLRLGIDKLNLYTSDFGLGQKTGIDLTGEQIGVVSSREVKENLQGEVWYLGDTCNTAIGQGLMRVTPLQMVAWISTIANGGTYYKPHIASSIIDGEGNEVEVFNPEVLYELSIDDENLKIVREGMHLVVNDPWGSAYPLRGFQIDPAAKTGSAEAYRKVDGKFETQGHSWITGFYPFDDPGYAFVVYLEFGGWGFKSAEVMRDFFNWYESEYLTK